MRAPVSCRVASYLIKHDKVLRQVLFYLHDGCLVARTVAVVGARPDLCWQARLALVTDSHSRTARPARTRTVTTFFSGK